MRMLFKQRFFSWLDSYDIYAEDGSTLYTVKGELALGHQLRINDAYGYAVGYIKEQFFTLLPPVFDVYGRGVYRLHPKGIHPVHA